MVRPNAMTEGVTLGIAYCISQGSQLVTVSTVFKLIKKCTGTGGRFSGLYYNIDSFWRPFSYTHCCLNVGLNNHTGGLSCRGSLGFIGNLVFVNNNKGQRGAYPLRSQGAKIGAT